MKYIKFIIKNIAIPLTILFIFQFIGNIINNYFINFLPGPVIGMLLLLIALYTKIVPFEIMETFSTFLVRHISFFLIPTTVSLLSIVGIIQNNLLKILLLLSCSLVIVLITVGYFASWYLNRKNMGEENE